MHILLVKTLSGNKGGAEHAFWRLQSQLSDAGVWHSVVENGSVFQSDPASRYYTIPLERLVARKSIPTLGSCLRMFRSAFRFGLTVAKIRPDIVNVHFVDSASVYVFLFRHIVGYKIVLTFHGSDIMLVDPLGKNLPSRYLHWALKRADAISGVSTSVLERVSLFSGNRSRCFLTPNGVDIDFWRRGRTLVDGCKIVAVGALKRVKGYDVLLEAIALVKQEYSTVHCTIVGEGPEKKALEGQVHDLGLSDQVEFAGWESSRNVRRILKSALVYAMPSRSEGMPSAALEAMAAGVPVVVSDVGGLAELIVDGVNGLKVKPNDPRALSKALCQIISAEAMRSNLVNCAAKDVERYSSVRMSCAYIQCYRQTLCPNDTMTENEVRFCE